MTAVRLTVTYLRVRGRRDQPGSGSKGGRVTEVHASWSSACVRLAELAGKRPVHHAAITDLAAADRNYEHHQAAVKEGRARG